MATKKTLSKASTVLPFLPSKRMTAQRRGCRAPVTAMPHPKQPPFDGSDAIDGTLMDGLYSTLKSLPPLLPDACFGRNLLSSVMVNSLNKALFFCKWTLIAKKVSRATEIPVSCLLAETFFVVRSDLGPLSCFGARHEDGGLLIFRNEHECMLDHAKKMAANKSFRRVINAVGDIDEFLAQIRICTLWSKADREERAKFIEYYALTDLDIRSLSEGA